MLFNRFKTNFILRILFLSLFSTLSIFTNPVKATKPTPPPAADIVISPGEKIAKDRQSVRVQITSLTNNVEIEIGGELGLSILKSPSNIRLQNKGEKISIDLLVGMTGRGSQRLSVSALSKEDNDLNDHKKIFYNFAIHDFNPHASAVDNWPRSRIVTDPKTGQRYFEVPAK